MGDSDRRLYRVELRDKMKRAELGRLAYGADPKRHDVFALERSRNNLLELRHDDVTTVDDSGRLGQLGVLCHYDVEVILGGAGCGLPSMSSWGSILRTR